jgi:hypothetical protein
VNFRTAATIATALLSMTACASTKPPVANPDSPIPGAASVESDSVINSDNRPEVKRTGLNANPDNAAGVSRGEVKSVYEIQK